jgi:DUF438 domain-containing protein
MSEIPENKKRLLKTIIAQLHAGASPQEVKERFGRVLEDISPLEIAKIEQELAHEGMPRQEIQRLCDVHLAVFREQLEKQRPQIPAEHPISILMEEHRMMLQILENISTIANKIQQMKDATYADNDVAQLMHLVADLRGGENHYLREENVLFPLLEKHGVTEPPAIMWTEHNHIREAKKALQKTVEKHDKTSFEDFKEQLDENVKVLNEILPSHFFKENNILFPAALRVASDAEWNEVRKEFDEIGYCCFTPPQLITAPTPAKGTKKASARTEGVFQFETGSLSKEEAEALFDSLPFDVTFVDKNDTVKYFSNSKERIFVRTKAVIGRKVQLCHPQKSVHIVNNILDAFKKGKKDVAEFWIPLQNKLVHIRYFAVRDKNGKYLGTIETTQDIAPIKKIEGERRLLDWEE